MGHTFSNLLSHVVFSTKDRRNMLYADLRTQLFPYMRGIANKEGATVFAINGIEDHVHVLVKLKPALAPSDFARIIKCNSSNWIHETFVNLKDFAWQSGFSAFSVSESVAPVVVEYIEKQEVHHHRMSFAEELRILLSKHGIEFDPEHYLD